MRFEILGPLAVADDEGREVALGGPKQRSVLAILLLHAGEVVSTDRLIDDLWGQGASPKAARTLQVYVSNLRKALGGGWVSTRAPGYVLSTERAELDVDHFQALVAEGRQALQAGDARRAIASLSEGLGLWRGPPLADLSYEPFAQGEIARLLEARLSALEDRIDAELALGGHGALVGELESLAREHPLRERLHGQLMLALYRSGRQAEALDAYRHAREHLSKELGLEPGQELRALQGAILNQDPSLTLPRAYAGASTSAPAEVERAVVLPRQHRKVVTMLYCKVERAPALGQQLDPEVLNVVINRYVGEMRAVIERHGGAVDSFLGSAVMAVFGVPQVREDDALQAVRAAAEISERLPAVADAVGVRLRWRMGINTGLVLVGTGEDLAIGDAVSVAARLGEAAAPEEIVIGPETLALVRGAVRVEPLESRELDAGPLTAETYRVLHVDRLGAGITTRHEVKLVGRERELGWLHEAWLRSAQEPGCQLVTLLGAAGVGKSRLVAELLASVDEEALVLGGRCLPYGEGMTFWPLLEALGPVTGTAAARVLERLESGAAMIPEELFLDIRRLLESLGRTRPVILYIDDLQWAQPTLLDLLDHLVDLSRGAPILVLCLARLELLENRPGWAGGKLRATSLLLEPLGIQDCEALVAQLDDRLAPDLRKQVVTASEGNPLFLEELVALSAERGVVALPPTIQTLLAARIERLPPEEREVLEGGAVEGEVFHRSSISALSQTRSSQDLDLRLASLVRKELIRAHPPTLADDDAYRFRHLLMRDVVYDGLPKAMRARLHERFARWLLDESPGDLVERDEISGWHLEQAVSYQRELGQEAKWELRTLATDQLRAAGRRAERRADIPAATTFLERALTLAPEDDPRRAAISAELAEQLIEAGELERADALLSAAEQDPEASTLAALARLEWLLHVETSQAPEAIRSTLPKILERLSRVGDYAGLARAHLASASLHWVQGHADDTGAEARLAAQHASRARDQGLRERSLRWYAWALRWGSAPASTMAEEIEGIERDEPGPLLAAELAIVRADLERYKGHFEETRNLQEQALETFRALGSHDTMAGHGQRLAETYMVAGDPEKAVGTLRVSNRILAERGERGLRSTVQAQLAQAYEQLGDIDAARAAIALAETLGGSDDIVNYVITHGVRARLALREGRGEDAERWALSSVKHAYMTDSIIDQGRATLLFAHILASHGVHQRATEEARRASELFAAKGDEFAEKQAEELINHLMSM